MSDITRENLPRHIAVIMDGNGRWAKKRLLNRINGHRKGIEVARETVRLCREMGIAYLTLYTFSKENWNRPALEVNMLMKYLEVHLRGEEKNLVENNIRFRAIGRVEDLPAGVKGVISDLEEKTRYNTGMVLQLALSYSGREEITSAAKKIARLVSEGRLLPEEITEETFQANLYTAGAPDPDLLIRTSGEMRISNFLLWQLAYTEIYICDALWPDFSGEHLEAAIRDYQKRERRFGLVKEKGVGAAG
ncbi:MAG TPA: isoprenyl transferase [Deltaproteobacteria bacterium]|nr:MAG: di-trans,poly-cis-decaprenylcistransferase [Deltaproteobacteria bacterium GWA2_55_82]OGQ63283.1 MAG: di-trans,poly-cis-decaprenylcistransferase [Deltaproteobacteria bacterium RIFCSPLOWO2_02_FULL_55_12]OIJ73118.1 MAG: di-trans,poly-cis-decaprenylcistransferase [Deltaproteobacteria bacterium GWC2_55_46]HBG47885.1 isoprenyl transferase [Deltaproteobacteria bacterium]HCY11852.1 isoprenyl transferase [Deltaproteobacteria bacterium]